MRTNLYEKLHSLFNSQRRFYFPFEYDIEKIPRNGIYILFERGEKFKHWDRIVRIGTHTGENQLRSRLKQHFIIENKDRSIFRKNIGRCIMNKNNNGYLSIWELDTTSKVNKLQYGHLIDEPFEKKIEKEISSYIQNNLSFTVFQVDNKTDRLYWESRIISTIASFSEIRPSDNWLGHYSPKEKIIKYGLWQVNELFNKQLDSREFNILRKIVISPK